MSALRAAGATACGQVLITGGAGFVGINLASHLLQKGERVRIFDCLARAGSCDNLAWLRARYPQRLEFVCGDVRDPNAVRSAFDQVTHVFHLAAQVAVTTSLVDPRLDFQINAQGTLNLLEAMRACSPPPSLLYSSTNKVYGVLPDLKVRVEEDRYVPVDRRIRGAGISEQRPLDFHSPYGCSKGAAEQYVLDYSRSFGLRTAVFRMSCIYGPHQHGTEDQGWIAHFVRRAYAAQPLTVYGDGCQVRDALFVEDLVEAFEQARRGIDALSGQAFNIGGGVANSVSILELLQLLERQFGRRLEVRFDRWRVGDQRYYVSDIRKFGALTGWRPRMGVDDGVAAMCDWFAEGQPSTHVDAEAAVHVQAAGGP